MKAFLLAALPFLALGADPPGQPPFQTPFTIEGSFANDQYSSSVSMNNQNQAIITAPQKFNNSGSIQFLDCSKGGTGSQLCESVRLLLSPNGALGDYFGHAADINDKGWVLASSPFKKVGQTEAAGEVYIMDCSTQACDNYDTLRNPSPSSEWLGHSVALNNEKYVVAGAPMTSDSTMPGRGSAHVFNCTVKPCTHMATLEPGTNARINGWFGHSVAISSKNWVVVGAPGENNGQMDGPRELQLGGAVYIFDCSTSACTKVTRLVAPMSGDNDYLGWSVAVSNAHWVVAGAVGASESMMNVQSGAVYTWDCSAGQCAAPTTLKAAPMMAGAGLGHSVAVTQTKWIVAGAPFASHVSMDGSKRTEVVDSGMVMLFDCSGQGCKLAGNLTNAIPPTEHAGFGFSVDANAQEWLAVGAPYSSPGNKAEAGLGYIFARTPEPTTPAPTTAAPTTAPPSAGSTLLASSALFLQFICVLAAGVMFF